MLKTAAPSHHPYLLVVRSGAIDDTQKMPSYRLRFQEQLYDVLMPYNDITAIGSHPTYVRVKGKRKDEVMILENTNDELTPLTNLQGVSLRTRCARERQEKTAEAIATLKGKLKEYGITNAMQLVDHTGFTLTEFGKHIGASEEICVLTGKTSAFLSNADLLDISTLLGWEYAQEVKQWFKNNGITSCMVVYHMNIDRVVRQLGYLHRHVYMGYDFQRSKSAEEKKEDLITKLGFDLIGEVKTHLLQTHQVSNSLELLLQSPSVLYKSLTATVINKVLKKDFVYKASEFTLGKRSLFCKKLGRIVEKDLYVYLCNSANSIENLYSVLGTNCTKFVEKYVRYLTAIDQANDRILSKSIAHYCQSHAMYFAKTDIVRRQFNFVLAMLLLGTGYTKNKEGTIHTQNTTITTLEQFVQKANAKMGSYRIFSLNTQSVKKDVLEKKLSTYRALLRDTGHNENE